MSKDAQDQIDMEKALLDPGSVFATPEDVVTHAALDAAQRIEILRRWSYDAAESAVALEEGMPGDESDLQQRIISLLDQLTGGLDVETTASNKQHGLPKSAVED